MKHWLVLPLFVFSISVGLTQHLLVSDSSGWTSLREGDFLSFKVSVADSIQPRFTLEGTNGYGIQFDTLGAFYWKPDFKLVDLIG